MTTKAHSLVQLLRMLGGAFALTILTIVLCQCGGIQPGNTQARYGASSNEDSYLSGSSVNSPSSSPSRKSRAGLGTSWGETRQSHVGGTSFVRATSRPASTLTIRYNNAEGAPDNKWSTRQPFNAGGVASIGIKSRGRYLTAYSTSSGKLVIGEHGDRYSIYVRNKTSKRIEVVLSVDGLDVLDGNSASHSKRGYVIAPRGRLEVEGFRRSYESVAAFRFGGVESSYAAQRHANTRNVGVIGAAVFRERSSDSDWHIRKNADPFPSERGSGQFAHPPGRH